MKDDSELLYLNQMQIVQRLLTPQIEQILIWIF